MKICPCCKSRLLRQVCRGKLYWFCPDCRQAMPILGEFNK